MLINPKLPASYFDSEYGLTPVQTKKNENVPVIVFEEFKDETYAEYSAVMAQYSRIPKMTEEEFEAHEAELRNNWLNNYPSGIAYKVYCWDGGCSDRPTEWGAYQTLQAAIAGAEKGPYWTHPEFKPNGSLAADKLPARELDKLD
jgi:hypothetical protein